MVYGPCPFRQRGGRTKGGVKRVGASISAFAAASPISPHLQSYSSGRRLRRPPPSALLTRLSLHLHALPTLFFRSSSPPYLSSPLMPPCHACLPETHLLIYMIQKQTRFHGQFKSIFSITLPSLWIVLAGCHRVLLFSHWKLFCHPITACMCQLH